MFDWPVISIRSVISSALNRVLSLESLRTSVSFSVALFELLSRFSTRHVALFSQPNPSPSGSTALDVHGGCEDAGACVGAVVSRLLPATMQVALFSQPNPSPSGSESGDWQIVLPLLSVIRSKSDALLTRSIVPVSGLTIQLRLFSHPQPSPSESLSVD